MSAFIKVTLPDGRDSLVDTERIEQIHGMRGLPNPREGTHSRIVFTSGSFIDCRDLRDVLLPRIDQARALERQARAAVIAECVGEALGLANLEGLTLKRAEPKNGVKN